MKQFGLRRVVRRLLRIQRPRSRQQSKAFNHVLVVSTIGGLGGPLVSLNTLIANSQRTEFTLFGPFLSETAARLRAHPRTRSVIVVRDLRTRTPLMLPWAMLRLGVLAVRRRRQFDMIMANGLTEASIAAPIAVLTRKPLTVWVHNSELPTSTKLMGPVLRSRALHVQWLPVSETAAAVIQGVLGRSSSTISPNPIAESEVLRSTDEVVTSTRLRVGYLGMARSFKGFDVLADIIYELDRAYDAQVEWVIFMFPGPMPEVHSRLTSRPNVRFVGRTHPPRRAFAQVDAVICPSRQESFGRVAAEAMMNGLPVLASRIPAFEQLLGPTAAHCLFDVEDVQQAAACVARLVESPRLRERLGQANAARAAGYSAAYVVPAMEALLCDSVSRRSDHLVSPRRDIP